MVTQMKITVTLHMHLFIFQTMLNLCGDYDVRVYVTTQIAMFIYMSGFTVEQDPKAQINYISTNSGQQGESLGVEISSTNMDFSQYYDDYSGMDWYEKYYTFPINLWRLQ